MTNWVTIPDTDVDQDSPGTVALFTALRDNVVAVTEGAANAPRLLGLAAARDSEAALPVLSVSAADTYVAEQGLNVVVGTTVTSSSSNVVARSMTVRSYTGTFRFKATHSSPGTFNVYMRILKNGVEQASWTTNGTATRSIDLAIVPGDTIVWEHRNTGGSVVSTFSNPIESGDDAYIEQPLYIAATLV